MLLGSCDSSAISTVVPATVQLNAHCRYLAVLSREDA
jgi:hypothetical protein